MKNTKNNKPKNNKPFKKTSNQFSLNTNLIVYLTFFISILVLFSLPIIFLYQDIFIQTSVVLIPYFLMFFNLINENYGKSNTNKVLFAAILSTIVCSLIINEMILQHMGIIQISFLDILMKVLLISLLFFVLLRNNVSLYTKIRYMTNKKHLWLRSLSSQILFGFSFITLVLILIIKQGITDALVTSLQQTLKNFKHIVIATVLSYLLLYVFKNKKYYNKMYYKKDTKNNSNQSKNKKTTKKVEV